MRKSRSKREKEKEWGDNGEKREGEVAVTSWLKVEREERW